MKGREFMNISECINGVNQGGELVVADAKCSAVGRNFLTPNLVGCLRVLRTDYAIEISNGTYFDGSVMYGLSVFHVRTGKIQPLGQASDAENLIPLVLEVVAKVVNFHRAGAEAEV